MRDESIVQMFDEGNVRQSAVSIIVSQRREMLLPRHSNTLEDCIGICGIILKGKQHRIIL